MNLIHDCGLCFFATKYDTMPQIISSGGELIRINATKNSIERSTNGGVSWAPRCVSSSAGDFLSLASDGSKLLATTSKGLYTSTNRGISWVRR